MGGLGENLESRETLRASQQLAVPPRPTGFSSVLVDTVALATFPWGRYIVFQGAGADCGRNGPCLCSTCISSAMVGTSEPCPGAPGVSRLGLRDHRRCGPFGDQLLRWCRREAGVQGGSDLAPTCCAYPGSGLWLEPLDPVEPLQPQLQRRHLAALPGGHCVPGCLWWCCVPGPQNPPERSQGHS